jgi:fibronectin-binding autotransporter adhesin
VQGGYDWGCNDGRFFNGWDASFGGLIGHNRGSGEQPVFVNFGTGGVLTSTTLADFSQSYVGGYAVFNRDRITADVQLRFERSEYTLNETRELDFTTPDPTDLFQGLGLSDTTFDADSINFTGRLSYRYDLNEEGLAFVPTAGISVTQTDGSTLTFSNATSDTLVLDPYTSKVAFIGGTLARSRIAPEGNAGTTIFVSGNYYKELGGDRTSTFTQDPAGAANVQAITASSIGGFAEASVGWNYVRILEDGPGGARQLNANIRADARFGENVSKAYSITAQVRLSF